MRIRRLRLSRESLAPLDPDELRVVDAAAAPGPGRFVPSVPVLWCLSEPCQTGTYGTEVC